MRQQIQQFGRTLSGMVMPNIGAFIAWGFITALFIPEGWWPNGQLAQLVGPMLTYLLPLLIAYTAGRNVAGERGGVIGAIAAVGVIVGSDIPMFIGAMIMGPLAGYAIRRFDRMVEGHVKAGFEMLVSNFSIGILGMLLAVLGYYVVGSVVTGLTMLISSGAELVIRHGLPPLVSLFVEPAKVLFLNNAVNHGIFSPIGIEQARETGQSIMFLLETNPGPGLGVLLAYWLFGRGNARQSAPGAVIIQFFGGIHEIYFPYILARPVLIVAAIAGSAAGLLFFSLTDAGLVAPASPGSILSVLAMAPKGKTLIVLLGVVISAAVSLVVAAPFIRRASKTETEGDPAVGKLPQSTAGISPHAAGRPVRKVIFACDAGMGSSALGATRFRKRLRDAEIGVAVGNSAADRIPSDADVVVCQSVLAERIAAAAKGAELIVIDNFLSDPGLDALFVRLEEAEPTAAGPETVSCGESDSDMPAARLAEAVLPSDVCDARSAGATPSSETSAFRPAETTASPDMPAARLAETTPSCGVSGSRSAQSALSCDQSGLRGGPATRRNRIRPQGRRSGRRHPATRKYPGRTACGAEGGGDPAGGRTARRGRICPAGVCRCNAAPRKAGDDLSGDGACDSARNLRCQGARTALRHRDPAIPRRRGFRRRESAPDRGNRRRGGGTSGNPCPAERIVRGRRAVAAAYDRDRPAGDLRRAEIAAGCTTEKSTEPTTTYMTSQKVTITAPNGMHARPAGELAKLVKGFAPVRITFRTAAKEVNAASMLALLSLGLKCGTEIEICAEGGDEAAAVKAVAAFIANMSE